MGAWYALCIGCVVASAVRSIGGLCMRDWHLSDVVISVRLFVHVCGVDVWVVLGVGGLIGILDVVRL